MPVQKLNLMSEWLHLLCTLSLGTEAGEEKWASLPMRSAVNLWNHLAVGEA